jgi:adenylate kinase
LGRILAKRWDLPLISAGDLLRTAAERIGPVARTIRQTIESGNLVSDEMVTHTMIAELGSAQCAAGFVLDGFPRTLPQARFLDEYLLRARANEPLVLQLQIAPELAAERLASRLQCVGCGRVYNIKLWPSSHPGYCDDDGLPLVRRLDDRESSVTTGLQRYTEAAAPLQAHYRDRHFHVHDASLPPGNLLEIVEGNPEPQASARSATA